MRRGPSEHRQDDGGQEHQRQPPAAPPQSDEAGQASQARRHRAIVGEVVLEEVGRPLGVPDQVAERLGRKGSEGGPLEEVLVAGVRQRPGAGLHPVDHQVDGGEDNEPESRCHGDGRRVAITAPQHELEEQHGADRAQHIDDGEGQEDPGQARRRQGPEPAPRQGLVGGHGTAEPQHRQGHQDVGAVGLHVDHVLVEPG